MNEAQAFQYEEFANRERRERLIELHNRSVRAEYGPNGEELYALDPYTGEDISPVIPPESLQQDLKLNQGYNFLADHASQLTVNVLLRRHSEAADLDIEGKSFEDRVAESDMLLLECIGWDEDLAAELNRLSRDGKISQAQYDKFATNEHHLRILNAINKSNTSVSFHDIDDGPGIRKDMIELADLFYETEDMNFSPEAKVQAQVYHTISFESFREWFMIGQIGYQIMQMAQNRGIDPSQMLTTRITMLIGSTHSGIVDKLRVFGAQVNEVIQNQQQDRFNQVIQESIKMGKANMSEIEHFAAED